MVTEIILAIIIAVLLVERYLSQRATQQERKEWTKAMLARNLQELTDNEVIQKLPKQEPLKPSDNVSMDDAIEDEELFDRHINAMKAEAKEQLDKELNP